jgi:NAD(P)-dependent dehydrogenase (short-subunit alcohol dehydrogenase family)
VVAGATRGAGRAIAVELGAAGATVYCTGRSVRGRPGSSGRPETIEETAEQVSAAGGEGIPVRVDHTRPDEVRSLIERLQTEQDGRLDLLVNDIWGGDELTDWNERFWEHSLSNGLLMQERAVHTHIITAYYAIPLMLTRRRGLIVEVTDGDSLAYRGNLFYDLAKTTVIRLGYDLSKELAPHGITALTVTPGFLRSEAVLDHLGVTEETWREGVLKDPYFAASETPHYLGRAVVALASDPNVHAKTGKVWSTWKLAPEYGFADLDGTQPNWGTFWETMPEHTSYDGSV